MSNTELESYVQLKFYPPVLTDEYVASIPHKVKVDLTLNSYLINTFGLDVATKFFIHNYTVVDTIDSQCTGVQLLWSILKPILIQYYEHHGT
jgi:hypothetical protein